MISASAVCWFNASFYSAALIVWFVVCFSVCPWHHPLLCVGLLLIFSKSSHWPAVASTHPSNPLCFSKFQFPVSISATVFLRCHLLFCKFSFLKDNLLTREVFMLGEENMVKVAGHCCALTASRLPTCDNTMDVCSMVPNHLLLLGGPCLQDVVGKIIRCFKKIKSYRVKLLH